MANRLKMAQAEVIKRLHEQGWSRRRIARELNINRETVGRYIDQGEAESKPANAPIGSEESANDSKPANAPIGSEGLQETGLDSKPANAPIGSWRENDSVFSESTGRGIGRDSDCEPYRQVILDKLEQGLSSQRIYQDLISDHGFASSYYSVRRFVKKLGQTRPLPFRRMECGPGEEAQVDFGSGSPVVTVDGKRRRTHVFRVVLSHSRKGYSEAVFRQTTENFIRCLENAFWHFGGVPRRLVLDNLRAAVSNADWYDPELNPKITAFAEHYGMAMLPTKPYMPRHKGKIERGIDYVKDNALKGRTFADLEEQNGHLRHWEQAVADTRVHGTTRRQVGKVFAECERSALLPLPAERFPFFHEGQRSVHRDGHVEVEKAYYSVPPEYVSRRLWVRWDSRLVRIFNHRQEQLAVHVKQPPGRFSTQRQHIVTEKINNVERGAEWLLDRVRRLGTDPARWAEAVLEERGIEGVRVLQGLLGLTKKYTCRQVQQACDIACSHGAYRLRTLRTLLKREEKAKQETFDFMAEDPLIRPLAEYDLFVRDAFREGFKGKEDVQ